MSPEREKGDFATGSSLLDNTKSELPLQGKRERRPILQKGCDFMFKHKTKIGAVILAMVTATALLSGCGADTAKEYDKHLKPETTVSVDKDADKVDDKKDSKESNKKADKADKQEDSKESSKPAKKPADKADNKDNGKKEEKPAENSKPSKPANSGAVNKPSKPSKPSNPAPSKPAPSKPSNPAPSEPAKPSKPNKPAHQHDWKTEYKTVHHEAQYRNEPVYKDEIVYEDRPVYKWSAYWTCNECGQRFDNEDRVAEHALMICGGGWTAHEEKIQTGTEQVQVGTNKVQIGTNQVLVKEAWDEKVPNGQVCTGCGAKK